MPICRTMRFRAISASPLSVVGCAFEVRAGMRCVVNGKEALGLDRCIALRRRQAAVTQQFLDSAQIATSAQEMRRKAVPQRMRGCGFRETEKAAQQHHL